MAAIQAALRAAHAGVLGNQTQCKAAIQALREGFAGAVQEALRGGQESLLAVGADWGGRTTGEAQIRALAYRKEKVAPKSEVRTFFEGASYEENKRNARSSAAIQTGEAYRDSYMTRAQEAGAGLGGAAPEVNEGAGAHIAQVEGLLAEHQQSVLKDLDELAQEATQAFGALVARARQQVVAQERAQLRELAAQEATGLQAIEGQLSQATSSATASGEMLKGSLEAGYGELAQALAKLLSGAQAASGAESPDPEGLGVALTRASEAMELAESSSRQTLGAQLEAGIAQLRKMGMETEAGLQQVSSQLIDQAQGLAAAFESSMQGLESALRQEGKHQEQAFQAASGEAVKAHQEGCEETRAKLEGELAAATENITQSVAEQAAALGSDFAASHAKMGATITSEAEAAAAKVQPAWKRVVAVVVKVIISVAVGVLIGVLCVGTGGIAVILLGSAAIGAVGGAMSYVVDCLSGQAEGSWKEFGKQAAIGAVGGLLTALTGGMKGLGEVSGLASMLKKGVAEWATQWIKNAVVRGASQVALRTVINVLTSCVQQVVANLFDEEVPWSEIFSSGQMDALKANIGPNFVAALFGQAMGENLLQKLPGGAAAYASSDSVLGSIMEHTIAETAGVGAVAATERVLQLDEKEAQEEAAASSERLGRGALEVLPSRDASEEIGFRL